MNMYEIRFILILLYYVSKRMVEEKKKERHCDKVFSTGGKYYSFCLILFISLLLIPFALSHSSWFHCLHNICVYVYIVNMSISILLHFGLCVCDDHHDICCKIAYFHSIVPFYYYSFSFRRIHFLYLSYIFSNENNVRSIEIETVGMDIIHYYVNVVQFLAIEHIHEAVRNTAQTIIVHFPIR